MRIKTNSKYKFICLDDIIPNPLVVDDSFVNKYFSRRFSDLMNDITDNSIPLMFMQYFGKSKNKKINSFITTMIDSYGLKKYNNDLVVDNEWNIVLDSNDNEIIINSIKDYYYSLKDVSIKSICELIDKRYYLKWSKLFNTLAFEYNPIKPFILDVDEKTKDSLESVNVNNKNGTNEKDRTYTSDEENVNERHETSINDYNSEYTNETIKDESLSSSYGYQAGNNPIKQNSIENKYNDAGGNSDVNNYANDKDESTIRSKKDSDKLTDVLSEDSTTNYIRDNNGERKTIRSGNIGNIPQQELVMRERNLWEYQLYDVIFKDLDKVLVIATYR